MTRVNMMKKLDIIVMMNRVTHRLVDPARDRAMVSVTSTWVAANMEMTANPVHGLGRAFDMFREPAAPSLVPERLNESSKS
jgi:hypothetical protein